MFRRAAAALVTSLIAAVVVGCGASAETAEELLGTNPNILAPVPNPFDDGPIQPHRVHPFAVALTPNGQTAFVTLRGSELEPGALLAVVDVVRGRLTRRVDVGPRPTAVRIHPAGNFAVVLSQLSRNATVHAVPSGELRGQIALGFYAQDLVFDPSGTRMFVSNRASDRIEEYNLVQSNTTLEATLGRSAPAGANPGALAMSPDGSKVYVTAAGDLGVRAFDITSFEQAAFIDLNAPVFDIKAVGPWMVATTLNDTDGLPCEDDADYPGEQGDGYYEIITDRTCSRGFADIQNEIAIIDPMLDEVAVRYTSDTAEISEADREGDHPLELMKVVGSLPFGLAAVGADRAFVTMGASFEVVELVLDDSDPAVAPKLDMPRAWDTGFAPRGIAADSAGETLVVANMLGESVSIFQTEDGSRTDVALATSEPPFPATNAEVGELFFFTSKYSTDGDQACVHCHPDAESDGKSWGVGVVRAFGRRATMPARNLRATKPLLIEGVFDENDFGLEMEAHSFRPDFHDSSYTLQVQRRDAFYREVSLLMFGVEVGYDAMVLRVGDYLMAEPRLLPNPFPNDAPEVNRGRELFFRLDVGCAFCHPSPAFATPELFEGTITMARFDRTRELDPNISLKYLENAKDGFFNANTLRGLWDRHGTFLHDGRARTVREVLLTDDHPCLEEGERGFNEHNGVGDVHGATSYLSCEQIDDLGAFLLSLD